VNQFSALPYEIGAIVKRGTEKARILYAATLPQNRYAESVRVHTMFAMDVASQNTSIDAHVTPACTDRWRAELNLRFEKAGEATRITERSHHGPLRLLKPLFPEGDQNCHAVIVHPPGGIVGGDSLTTTLIVDEGAHAVATTPGAQKWYRSTAVGASATTTLRLHNNAALEWIPQEAIVFDGAIAQQDLHIHLADSSKLFAWEMLCLGRSARNERFLNGRFSQQIRIFRNDGLLWQERTRLSGDDLLLTSPLGWGGNSVSATAWIATGQDDHAQMSADTEMLASIREALADSAHAAASNVAPGFFLVKVAGEDAESVRELLIGVWSRIRFDVFGLEPQRPRIWST
jgi:urease accessory protein